MLDHIQVTDATSADEPHRRSGTTPRSACAVPAGPGRGGGAKDPKGGAAECEGYLTDSTTTSSGSRRSAECRQQPSCRDSADSATEEEDEAAGPPGHSRPGLNGEAFSAPLEPPDAGDAATPCPDASSTTALCHHPSEPRPAAPGRRGGKRVAIVVNGSEGDVRPLIALAKAMRDRHAHAVRVFTNANLVPQCTRHGIDAVPVYADTRAVLLGCGGLRGSFVEAVTKPAEEARRWLRDHRGEYVAVEDALEGFRPDAIIVGAQALTAALRYEHEKHVPVIPVFLSRPWLDEGAFNFVADKKPTRPSFYTVSETIDQNALPFKAMMRSGAWVLNEMPTAGDLSPGGSLHELKQFLEHGPAPVAIGWGSMLAEEFSPQDMLEMALRALMHVGKRGVVLGGWAGLDGSALVAQLGQLPSRIKDGGRLAAFAARDVCFVPYAPHAWLFPQCCCVVHHGGVGTTQSALRAGKPSVVTPICADQFFSAEAVNGLRVGVGFKDALPALTIERISRAIHIATEDAMVLQAEMLGRRMRAEEGQALSRVSDMLDGFMRNRVKFVKGRWVRLKSRTPQQRARTAQC